MIKEDRGEVVSRRILLEILRHVGGQGGKGALLFSRCDRLSKGGCRGCRGVDLAVVIVSRAFDRKGGDAPSLADRAEILDREDIIRQGQIGDLDGFYGLLVQIWEAYELTPFKKAKAVSIGA